MGQRRSQPDKRRALAARRRVGAAVVVGVVAVGVALLFGRDSRRSVTAEPASAGTQSNGVVADAVMNDAAARGGQASDGSARAAEPADFACRVPDRWLEIELGDSDTIAQIVLGP